MVCPSPLRSRFNDSMPEPGETDTVVEPGPPASLAKAAEAGPLGSPAARAALAELAALAAQVEQAEPFMTSMTSMPAAPKSRRRGRLIAGRFQLLGIIGRGAMGEVWRAHDRNLRLEVAVKFFFKMRGPRGADALERFRFEAQVAAQLGKKTPHVVAVHDVGEDGDDLYLVMDYVRGRTLRQELVERGPMTPAHLAPLLEQVAEALSHAHGLGIVHRDIKPSNVLLVDDPRGRRIARLTDFGIAKGISKHLALDLPSQTRSGVVLGTPNYMSPEQACGGQVDTQADLWALAVVAHEAITGLLPFTGRSAGEVLSGVLSERRQPLTVLRPDLPEELEAWFARAFALESSQRFTSVEEMIAAYRAAIGAPPSLRRMPDRSPLRGKEGLAVGFFAGVAVALPLAVAMGWGGLSSALPPPAVKSLESRVVRAAGAVLAPAVALPLPGAGAEDPAVAGTPAKPTAPAAAAAEPAPPAGAAPPGDRAAPRRQDEDATKASWKSGIF